jgi:hypothetical protein
MAVVSFDGVGFGFELELKLELGGGLEVEGGFGGAGLVGVGVVAGVRSGLVVALDMVVGLCSGGLSLSGLKWLLEKGFVSFLLLGVGGW